MKHAEFDLCSGKIEFYNSIYGMEKVVIDSKEVSRKFSFMGTEHPFQRGLKYFVLRSKFQPFEKKVIALQLLEDGKLIERKIVSVNKKHKIFWSVFGIIAGFGAYQLLVLLFGIITS